MRWELRCCCGHRRVRMVAYVIRPPIVIGYSGGARAVSLSLTSGQRLPWIADCVSRMVPPNWEFSKDGQAALETR